MPLRARLIAAGGIDFAHSMYASLGNCIGQESSAVVAQLLRGCWLLACLAEARGVEGDASGGGLLACLTGSPADDEHGRGDGEDRRAGQRLARVDGEAVDD